MILDILIKKMTATGCIISRSICTFIICHNFHILKKRLLNLSALKDEFRCNKAIKRNFKKRIFTIKIFVTCNLTFPPPS